MFRRPKGTREWLAYWGWSPYRLYWRAYEASGAFRLLVHGPARFLLVTIGIVVIPTAAFAAAIAALWLLVVLNSLPYR